MRLLEIELDLINSDIIKKCFDKVEKIFSNKVIINILNLFNIIYL